MPTSTSGFMLMLGIPAIALLWLIFRSSARPGAVGAEKWVPRAIGGFGVFMALSAGIFIGSMVVTISGVSFPQVVQIADPLVCEGTVSTATQRYSYKPGQHGLNRSFICDAGDGSPPREITLSLLAAASSIYSAVAFVLLLMPVLLLSKFLPQLVAALRAKRVVVSGGVGSSVGTQALEEFLHGQFQSTGGSGSSTSEVNRTWVVVNNDTSSNPTIAALQDVLLKNADHLAADAVMAMHQRGSGDPAERLRALRALQEQGLLTASEYEAKRAEILAKL